MFSKATDRGDAAAERRGGASATPSIISADMRVSGDLRTEGDVQVDGVVDGDIQSHSVTVGKSAEINGEVVADSVVVWGRINGRIRCKDVTLEESAVINGDVLHDSLQVARGAQVEGMVKRGTSEERGAKVNLVVADGEAHGAD
ncbi:MAG: polymer-forming cytoskeletal protein [Azospirillaceae bacterium]